MQLGIGLGITYQQPRGGGGGGPSPFAEAAERILYAVANPHTVDWSPASAPTIDTDNTGNSTVNTAKTLAAGGQVPTANVPDGYSCPMNANSRWIVTKTVANQVESNRTFAPGNSKLFVFEGQKFDFKAGPGSGKTFSVRWSEDGGLTWSQTGLNLIDKVCWCLVDFGSAATRVVEVIGEDEIFQTFGWNFAPSGSTPPAAWTYPAEMPRGVMFGDSYVFGDGELGGTGTNGEYGTKAMTRKVAEKLGHLQIRNHGFRTNGFANDQSDVQSMFAERMKLPTEDPDIYALSEGLVMGEVDYIITPGSINDHSGGHTDDRAGDVERYFRNAREMQPSALLLCPVGFTPPQTNEPAQWLADMKAGFNAVFGETEAEWIANGAYFLDGSRATGAEWIPAGAEGSSDYFGTTNKLHPNAAGHDYAAELYSNGLIYLAQQVLA